MSLARDTLHRQIRLAALALPVCALATGAAWAQDVSVTGEVGARQSQTTEPAGGDATPDTEIRGLEIHESVNLEEVLTDNARASAAGGQLTTGNGTVSTSGQQSRSADAITRLTPSIAIVNRGPRSEGALTITPTIQRYAINHDLDRSDVGVTGTNLYTLWRDHLTVATSTSTSRQIVSSQGTLTAADRSSNQNQATLSTYAVTPTFTQHFHNFATGTIAAQLAETSTGVLASSTQSQLTAQLASGSDWARFVWAASLQATDANQSSSSQAGQVVNGVTVPTGSSTTSQRTANFTGKYALDRTFALLGSFGYEAIDNPTLTKNESGPIASIGIGITGTRSHLNLAYNYRYDSKFISTDGSYDITERVQFKVSYNETVTTSQQQAISNVAGLSVTPQGGFSSGGSNFSPVTSPSGINGGAGNAAYHDQKGQVTLTGAFDRNTFTFGLQNEVQTTETTGFKSTTLAVVSTFARELSPSTNVNAALNYTQTNQTAPTTNLDNTYDVSLGMTTLIGRNLTASATYSLLYRQSSGVGQNLTENALTVGLRKSF